MARIYPPKAFKKYFLPHPEGEWRAPATRKKALSTYFFFFAVLFFTLFAFDQQVPNILGYATNISSGDVINKTNEERSKHGLSTLQQNSVLRQAAEAKARDMFTDDYWAHTAPDGKEPWDFIDEAGYTYLSAGENLAKDFNHSDSVVKAWMDSSSHRANILNSSFNEIGVAVVNGELNGFKTTLVVQMFGKPQPSYVAQVGGEETEKAAEVMVQEPVPQAEGAGTELALKDSGERPSVNTEAFAGSPVVERVEDFSLRHFGWTAGFLCGVFLLVIFALDFTVAHKRNKSHLNLRTISHIGLLILLLFGIWYTQVGSIL